MSVDPNAERTVANPNVNILVGTVAKKGTSGRNVKSQKGVMVKNLSPRQRSRQMLSPIQTPSPIGKKGELLVSKNF